MTTTYPFTEADIVNKFIVQDIPKTNLIRYSEMFKLKVGTYIVVDLSSQEIDFTKSVTKKLAKDINIATFTGKPKETCYPGMHSVKLSITDKRTDHEYVSQTFEVRVVDLVFGFISRPFLSGLISIILGLGSLVTYVLTLLGKVDQGFGLTSGTTAALLAAVIYGRVYNMYSRTKETMRFGE